ncbi:MAG: phenylacetate--CoA ligase family protein [Deltaproteobacteria bacterium]|nr:phenylacetate--CoA ligase family protein [Deltaproteobacteria bacterium]
MLWNCIRTVRLLRRALATSRWPPERLRAWQWRQLCRRLDHAYSNVPLYRKLYDECGFHPRDVRGLEDLGRVPVLRKERLRATAPADRVARGVRLASCRPISTSGSTGTPLQIFLDEADQCWQRATAWRILFEHGYRLTDRTVEIRATLGQRFFVQSLGVARKDWLSLRDPPAAWVAHLERTRAQVVVACATTLAALAEAASAGGARPRPRLAFSDSEPLTPPLRKSIQQGLGCDPIDVFGLVELSNFAWQCEQRQGFHVSADSHLVEIDPERATLIVTDLGMTGMPIVRYDTGDTAEIESEPCPCGRTLPRLRAIHGRAIESVVLASGQRLFWPFFHEVLGAFAEIRQWRVLALPGHTPRVQLAAASTIVPHVRRTLAAAAPELSDWEIETLPEIPWRPGEKLRLVVTGP